MSDIVACFYRNLFILSPRLLELVPHRSSVVVLLPEDAHVPGVVGKPILHLGYDGVLSRAWRVREIPQNHDCQHHIPHGKVFVESEHFSRDTLAFPRVAL